MLTEELTATIPPLGKDGWLYNKEVATLELLQDLKSCDFRCTSTSRSIEAMKICCNSSSGKDLQFRLGQELHCFWHHEISYKIVFVLYKLIIFLNSLFL